MEGAEAGRSPGAPAAARRYYGCVFCKRGFTTAQALGGHMNVHRRDRPKPAPATGCYMAAYPPSEPAPQPPMMRCGGNAEVTLWPAAAAAGSPSPRPRELSLFRPADNDDDDDGHDDDHDLRLGLGCHGGGLRAVEEGADQPERNKQLDLELRLGPRPRH